MSGEPYISAEDSALLRSAVRGLSGESCLEIGAGNGGNLIELKKGFRLAVGTDLQRSAASDWRGNGIEFVLTDAASCLRSEAFDLVAFNPPYLAVEITDDRSVEGGKDLAVPKAFLREALRTVKRTGKIVFLLNDEADIAEFEGICSEKSFVLTRVATKRTFFEELSVYSAAAAPGARADLTA